MRQQYSHTELLKPTISKFSGIELIPESFEKDKLASNIVLFIGANESSRYSLSKKVTIKPCWASFRIANHHLQKNWIKKRTLEPNKSFESERDAFFKIQANLLKSNKYADKFVAILNGKVVGSGKDKSSLAKRVYKKYGYVPIYMEKVCKPKRVRHLPSPERWV